MNKIQKNDTVQILLGKDRGKSGKVDRVVTKEGKVFVEGINVFKRHVRRQGQLEGGVLDIRKPVNISNVAIVCQNCKKITRVGFKQEGDTKLRVCRKCGKEIK